MPSLLVIVQFPESRCLVYGFLLGFFMDSFRPASDFLVFLFLWCSFSGFDVLPWLQTVCRNREKCRMVSGVFGLPGSGKTLYLSYLAKRAVNGKSLIFRNQFLGTQRKYDAVYTSFPFAGAYKLDYETLGKVKYEKCLFLIDEIMMFSDSRNFKSFTSELKFFFSQHRHFQIDIVYASQSYDDTDKKIRNVTDHLYYVQRSVFLGCSVVKPIRAFFRIEQGQIMQGYEFADKLQYYWFKRSSLFENVDTNFSVALPDFQPYVPELWSMEELETMQQNETSEEELHFEVPAKEKKLKEMFRKLEKVK